MTYEILFLKEKEERDGDYFERDDLGRVIPITINIITTIDNYAYTVYIISL